MFCPMMAPALRAPLGVATWAAPRPCLVLIGHGHDSQARAAHGRGSSGTEEHEVGHGGGAVWSSSGFKSSEPSDAPCFGFSVSTVRVRNGVFVPELLKGRIDGTLEAILQSSYAAHLV